MYAIILPVTPDPEESPSNAKGDQDKEEAETDGAEDIPEGVDLGEEGGRRLHVTLVILQEEVKGQKYNNNYNCTFQNSNISDRTAFPRLV